MADPRSLTAHTFSHADGMALEDMHDQLRRVVLHGQHCLDLIEFASPDVMPNLELSLRSAKAHMAAAIGDFKDINNRRAGS